MPIGIIITAAALGVAGTGGLGLGTHGVLGHARAKRDAQEAESLRVAANKRLAASKRGLEARAADYGTLQVAVQESTLAGWKQWLIAQEKRLRREVAGCVDGVTVGVPPVMVAELESLHISSLVGGSVGSAVAGVAAQQAALWGVQTFAAASTGAAISGLSGAAAESATLAWLGGGTLASGGAGVAGGSMVLAGVAVAPALLVGGAALAVSGNKSRSRAATTLAQTRKDCLRLEQQCIVLDGLRARVDEMSGVLTRLNQRADSSLQLLSTLDFDPQREDHMRAMMLAKALMDSIREVLATPIIDEAGGASEASLAVVRRYAA